MKKVWLTLQSALLSLAVISWFAGMEDLFGICVTVLIILSFPLNLLAGWLFFAFDVVHSAPALLLVMAFVMSAIGYVQWFELVPRIVGFFSGKLSRHDREIRLTVERQQPAQLEKGRQTDVNEWLDISTDKEEYSPVERVFGQK